MTCEDIQATINEAKEKRRREELGAELKAFDSEHGPGMSLLFTWLIDQGIEAPKDCYIEGGTLHFCGYELFVCYTLYSRRMEDFTTEKRGRFPYSKRIKVLRPELDLQESGRCPCIYQSMCIAQKYAGFFRTIDTIADLVEDDAGGGGGDGRWVG